MRPATHLFAPLLSVGLFAMFAAEKPVHAATYKVGPGKTYTTLASVAGLLLPGDLVEVDGNNTYNNVTFTKHGSATSKITIRGIPIAGKRPQISGGNNSVELAGDHYIFEGFDVTAGTSRCVYHHAHDITIRDSVVHDCPKQGILGADTDSGSLLLEYTEVYKCGGGTQDHQIYMATNEVDHPGSVFRMQFCYVHDANGGNSVKSRAERNEIYYNWIEGALYHELELIGPDPSGGVPAALKREDSDVVGNVLRKTKDFSFVRTGGDGTGESKGRYRFVNNTFIGISGGNTAFRIFDGIESIEMHNNVFFRLGGGTFNITRTVEAAWVSGEQISGSNNWIMTGATAVPAKWIGTVSGVDPGFVAAAANNFAPAAGSPLVDKGAAVTAGPVGYAFPAPLVIPAFVPPKRTLLAVGTATTRPTVSGIDIGAYEFGTSPTDAGLDSAVGDVGLPDGPGVDSSVATDSVVDGTTEDSLLAPDTPTVEGGSDDVGSPADIGPAETAPDTNTLEAGALDSTETGSAGGCGCHTGQSSDPVPTWLALTTLAMVIGRRRPRIQR